MVWHELLVGVIHLVDSLVLISFQDWWINSGASPVDTLHKHTQYHCLIWQFSHASTNPPNSLLHQYFMSYGNWKYSKLIFHVVGEADVPPTWTPTLGQVGNTLTLWTRHVVWIQTHPLFPTFCLFCSLWFKGCKFIYFKSSTGLY